MGLFSALTAAAIGFGVSKAIGGGSDKKENSAPAPLPMPEAPKVEDAAEKAEAVARKRKVAQSQSVYTSPLGASGEANVVRKTLLGQ